MALLLLLAGVWYGVLFKETWEEIVQADPTKKSLDNEIRGFVLLVVITSLVTISHMIILQMLQPGSIVFSIGCAIGITGATILPAGLLYALGVKQPITHWLINSGYWILAAVCIGCVFAIWP